MEPESFVGRKCLMYIIEPTPIASNKGDPPLAGRIIRYERTKETEWMFIQLEKAIEDEGVVSRLLIASPRHEGEQFKDMVRYKWRVGANAMLAEEQFHHALPDEIPASAGHFYAIVSVWLAE